MSGVAITSLTAAEALDGSELLPLVQSGETRKITVLDVVTFADVNIANKVDRSGDYLENVQYVGFDTSISVAPSIGELAWNSNDGTLDVGLLGGSVLQLGQETLFYVKNTSGATITDGQFVMATGAVGASGKLTAAAAVADGTISPEYFLGIATQEIPDQEFGYVTHFGLVRGIDTTGAAYSETWADGDLLYANPSVVGGLTKQAPPFPGFLTPIAIVVAAGPGGSGSVFVRMKSGEYLRELHDVNIVAPVSGDVISYVSATGAWTNSDVLVQVQASVSVLQLTKVSVSSGQIWNPTITNYTETAFAPASVASYAVSLDKGTIHQIYTIDAATSVSLPAAVNGKSFVVIIYYGGTHSITWTGGTTIKWSGGVAPTASSSATAADIFAFFQDTSATYGTLVGRDF